MGLPAFGLEDGRAAGRVADLLFSGRGERVIGLLLGEGTWWRRRLIPYEEVAAIGPAAVMLRRPVVLRTPDGPRLRRLRRRCAAPLGLRVLSRDGRDLGIVDDIYFDPVGGAVVGYLVSQGLVSDVARGKGFLPLARVAPEGATLRLAESGTGPWLLIPPV